MLYSTCYVHTVHKTCKTIQCPLTLQSTCNTPCDTTCDTSLLHSIISRSSSLRQWQNTFIVTSLHDLFFLVTWCPLNALKTPMSMFHTKSLCIVFWSNIFLNGSSPLIILIRHLLWQIHHNLLYLSIVVSPPPSYLRLPQVVGSGVF